MRPVDIIREARIRTDPTLYWIEVDFALAFAMPHLFQRMAIQY